MTKSQFIYHKKPMGGEYYEKGEGFCRKGRSSVQHKRTYHIWISNWWWFSTYSTDDSSSFKHNLGDGYMSELNIITDDRAVKKKKNTKFWIVAGIIINIIIAIGMILIGSDIAGIVITSAVMWMLVLIIMILSNNKIGNGDE